jgi:AraC family transcriptional regulator of adaptative response/methylated-DNA-[protein]-cysteine methyltransferase
VTGRRATPEDATAAGAVGPRAAGAGAAVASVAETALDPRIRRVADRIRASAGEPLTLAVLAADSGLSPSYLQRAFRHAYGVSPKEFQTALRLESLKSRLRDGEPVSDATYAAGFGSSRGAYEAAVRGIGMSPVAYRRGGRGLTIRYAFAPSSLGLVLVGATDAGLCCAMLADDEPTLETALHDEFPAADLLRDDAAGERARLIAAYVDGIGDMPRLPLDLQGTDFQRRVWEALLRIPAGETLTYSEVAGGIGAPTSQRAVANACGGNHLAIVVPCHRVVRSDGGLGGYKWGVERKRRLLEREGALTTT